jgi:hypothetical protein
MLRNLARLGRYRGLIQSLVARELKARYRGSVLGFFWSFFNPLLLLLVYSFVFTYVMTGAHDPRVEPYALFMFCGILPWTWFSSSLLEASNVLIAGGNLIRKVLFPAEVLPLVTVFAGLVHFCLGLPILAAFLIYYRVPLVAADLAWFPVIVLIQLVLTAGLALLVSALVEPARRGAVEACFFRESTTIGVRRSPRARTVLARKLVEVETSLGSITVKLSGRADASGELVEVTNAAPELEACRRIAEARGAPAAPGARDRLGGRARPL